MLYTAERFPILQVINQLKWKVSIQKQLCTSRMAEFKQKHRQVSTIDFGVKKLKRELRPLQAAFSRERRAFNRT